MTARRTTRPFVHMTVTLLCIIALIGMIVATDVQLARAQSTADNTTIKMVADCLNRMGEKKIAKRLIKDYSTSKVTIADLGGGGVRAETGSDSITGSGPNSMTLDASIVQQVGDMKELTVKSGRTYNTATSTLSWATTVVHEYVHMDQDNPKETSEFENDAWQRTNATMVKWYTNLDKEFQKVKKEKPSVEKGKKLQELSDLMSGLNSEFGGMQEGITAKIKEGVLSQGLTWRAPGLQSKDLNSVFQRITDTVGTENGLITAELKANTAALKNTPTPKPTKTAKATKHPHPVIEGIYGPSEMKAGESYTFSIKVSGGTAPYYYEWKGNTAPAIMYEGTKYSSVSLTRNNLRSPGANDWYLFISVKDSAGEYATWLDEVGMSKWEFTWGITYTPPKKDSEGNVIEPEKWEVNTWPTFPYKTVK